MKYITLVLQGMCMGMADIVPGVSGGTMAYILGIYEKLLKALRSFDAGILHHIFRGELKMALLRPWWAFLLPLGIGILLAIIIATKIIGLPELIRSDPELVYAVFFGLIIGSLLLLLKSIGRPRLTDALWMALGTVAALLVLMMGPQRMPDSELYLILAGMLAVSVMLLPGISGSYLLLLLGKYTLILTAISQFDLGVLLPFIGGMLLGFLLFPRIVGWLLVQYHRRTLVVINGLLLGSLWAVWPFQNRIYDTIGGKEKLVSFEPYMPPLDDGLLLPALLAVGGFAFVLMLDIFAYIKRS